MLKQFMYSQGRPKIREQINKYILSLKSDYAKNLILPKKDDAQVREKRIFVKQQLLIVTVLIKGPDESQSHCRDQ